MVGTAAIDAAEWLNVDDPPTVQEFHGRVLAVEVFQMLCPGCVMHGLPQAQRIAATFDPAEVAVIGLHSVFEHHAANSRAALEAFLHEWRIRFPVAIDAPGEGRLPRTMERWQLQGTPTLVLFDRRGEMRARHFGQVADLALGAEIMAMTKEPVAQGALG
ncbi:MAG: TlpA family protein disulfide reductase [Alphaproteobacteria bacterium]|nr:MAG: TlpA family protein disulfide reductase [Alphaproteobacteria bacterium]